MMRDPSAKYSETAPNPIVRKAPRLRIRSPASPPDAPPPANKARAHNRKNCRSVTKLDPGDEELPVDASEIGLKAERRT